MTTKKSIIISPLIGIFLVLLFANSYFYEIVEAGNYVKQKSYTDDCITRPKGSVCISFSDGFVWLVYDSITGWDKTVKDGQTVEIAKGFEFHYYHILNTNLVKQVPIVTIQPAGQPPIAKIDAPSSSLVEMQITFYGIKSLDPDGSIVSYIWSFGDGGSASGSKVFHSYSDEGSYEVTLTVTDNDGLQNTASITIEIFRDLPIILPDADGDGIPDTIDQCPTQRETFNGFNDEDGCPDESPEVAPPPDLNATLSDADGDGIPDPADHCPTQRETFNGFEDDDGCPDKKEIIVIQALNFYRNTGQIPVSVLVQNTGDSAINPIVKIEVFENGSFGFFSIKTSTLIPNIGILQPGQTSYGIAAIPIITPLIDASYSVEVRVENEGQSLETISVDLD